MSWGASVGPVAASEFEAAVDACETSPPESGLAEEPAAQLKAARCAAVELAATIGVHDGVDDGKRLRASLSGHACSEGESGEDSISVSLQQVAAGA